MRKLFISLFSLLLIVSCQKQDAVQKSEAAAITGRTCASEQMLKARLAADPSLRTRLQQIEAFTRRITADESFRGKPSKTIEIPVVVHVLYNAAEQNISDAQIQSQMDVLNEDFNLKNRDNTRVPSVFSDLKADVGVHFTLAQTIRKYSSRKIWAVTDNMKFASRGGSDAVDPAHKLNIWVCNLGQNVLGFAYSPGISPELDGVVILYSAFGRTGPLLSPYNKGRTTTHEVGHWMNLRHIWGDATCGDDLVGDTPKHTTANFGCPEFPHYNDCGDHAIEMTMNYMDYTDDACMFMFSNGQKARMLAVFASGGPRDGFAQ